MAYALMLYLWVGIAGAVCTSPHRSMLSVLTLITLWPLIAYREWVDPQGESLNRGGHAREWVTGESVAAESHWWDRLMVGTPALRPPTPYPPGDHGKGNTEAQETSKTEATERTSSEGDEALTYMLGHMDADTVADYWSDEGFTATHQNGWAVDIEGLRARWAKAN